MMAAKVMAWWVELRREAAWKARVERVERVVRVEVVTMKGLDVAEGKEERRCGFDGRTASSATMF